MPGTKFPSAKAVRRCVACKEALPSNGSYITCSVCEGGLHYGTCSVSRSTWAAKGDSKKREWKCVYCRKEDQLNATAMLDRDTPRSAARQRGKDKEEKEEPAVGLGKKGIARNKQDTAAEKGKKSGRDKQDSSGSGSSESDEESEGESAKEKRKREKKVRYTRYYDDRRLEEEVEEMKRSLQFMSDENEQMRKKRDTLEGEVKSLKKEVQELRGAQTNARKITEKMKKEHERNQQYDRNRNVEIFGLKRQKDEDLPAVMIKLAAAKGIEDFEIKTVDKIH